MDNSTTRRFCGIDEIADATGDHQWIHVDPQRAADGPVGTTIAHGLLTSSLLPHFPHAMYRVDDASKPAAVVESVVRCVG